jgi:hypothetical protein
MKTKSRNPRRPSKELRAFLAEMIKAPEQAPQFCRFYSHLREHGRTFVGSTPSGLVPAAKAWKRSNRPEPKCCHGNSQLFAMHCATADYYEGLVSVTGAFIPHGWNVMKSGEVIDLTLEDLAEPADRVYFGIHVPTVFVARKAVERRACGFVAPAFVLGEEYDF